MLAVPALAGITVDCTIDGNEVTVTYAMDGGDANLPRAFGLEIVADANISMDTELPSSDINDSDFYIYPGTIDVNDDTGDVDDYGTPVAELDANTMIIEMGSLYATNDPDHNTAPPSSGWLIKFRVASASPIVDIREDADRGGVVMEDVDYNFPGGYVDCDQCGGVVDYNIEGTVTYMGSGLDGVTISGLPNSPIVTSGGGLYSDTVSSGWSGTVTPSISGKGFKPTSRVYSNVTSDQLNQDYCAYPGCWDYTAFCNADGNNDVFVSTLDFPPYRDGFMKSYPNATYVANACGDFNRDGQVTTLDFPPYRDNFMKTPATGCTQGDINGVFCP
jgi:hypothetical protein